MGRGMRGMRLLDRMMLGMSTKRLGDSINGGDVV